MDARPGRWPSGAGCAARGRARQAARGRSGSGPPGRAGTRPGAPRAAESGGPERSRAALGRYGEDLAAAHLARAGLRILDRNWRCAGGEIDILARSGGTLVVVEVKTRTGRAYGTPLEAVDRRKRRRLRRLARAWRDAQCGPVPPRTRVDVVGVLVRRDGRAFLRHDRGVG
ncbi:hypothetical protein GCM10027440_36710 [Nocardiopsis coralliicola]